MRFIWLAVFIGALPLTWAQSPTRQDLDFLKAYLGSPVEPNPIELKKYISSLPAETRARLTNNSDLENMRTNAAFADFLIQTKLSIPQLYEIRNRFLTAMAKDILRKLKDQPDLHIRLLARDMNDVYLRLIKLLAEKNLSSEDRLNILMRVNVANMSRPMANALRTEADFLTLLQMSKEQVLKADRIALIDLGYNGSITKTIGNLPLSADLRKRLRWYFIWKSPMAPSEIKEWMPEDFLAEVRAKFPNLVSTERWGGNQRSFRTKAIEHIAKWHGRIENFSANPVEIVLDQDSLSHRPALEVLFRDLESLLLEKRVKLFAVGSRNDMKELKFNGRFLKSWDVEFIGSEKDLNRPRLISIKNFPKANDLFEDALQIRQFTRTVYQNIFISGHLSPEMRQRTLLNLITELGTSDERPALVVKPKEAPAPFDDWQVMVSNFSAVDREQRDPYLSKNAEQVLRYLQGALTEKDSGDPAKTYLWVIENLSDLSRRNLISRSDYRRTLARIFGQMPLNEKILKGLKELMGRDEMFTTTLKQRTKFFLTTKKSGTKRTSEIYSAVVLALNIQVTECADLLIKTHQ